MVKTTRRKKSHLLGGEKKIIQTLEKNLKFGSKPLNFFPDL